MTKEDNQKAVLEKEAQKAGISMEELMGNMGMGDIVDPEEPEWVKQFKKIAKG